MDNVERVERFLHPITDRRWFFTILAMVLIICLAVIWKWDIWDDVPNYWNNIDFFYSSGLIPYKDYVFEYPPFSFVIFLIPRLFAWDETSFMFAYAIFAGLCYAGTSWLILDMVGDDQRTKRYVCLLLLVIPLMSLRFIITRNDIFACASMILALWLYKKDKVGLACIVLAVGTMIKLYPALMMVPIVCEYFSTKDYRKFLRCIVLFVSVCILINLPFMIIDFGTAFNYLSYHSDRNIEIESVISTPIFLAHLFGFTTIYSDWSSGSRNIVGEIPDMLSPYLFYVMAAAMVFVSVYVLYKFIRNRTDNNNFGLLCLSTLILILTFVTFNKVYSAQYMIWILILCPMLIMTISKGARGKATIICLLFGITSAIAYPFYHWDFINYRYVIPEAIKNIVTVALLIYCIILFVRNTYDDGAQDIVKNEDPDIEK